MSVRKQIFVEGEFYHIYNRGNSRKVIFHDDQDYFRFQKILYLCNGIKKFKYKDMIKVEKDPFQFDRGDQIVSIVCYVLMPNHFHLFLTPNRTNSNQTDKNIGNNVSVFLKRVTMAYSQYYNFKYSRTGTLFEGRFKSEYVDSDEYFKYLFSYIHLNPVKLLQSDWKEKGIKNIVEVDRFLQSYKYSSFGSYFNTPDPVGGVKKIVDTNIFLNHVPPETNLEKEIFDWLKFETIN